MSADFHTGRNGNGSGNGAARIPFMELVAPFQFIADGLVAGLNYAADAAFGALRDAARRRRARQTIDRLRGLDNHMLRDIGIDRSDISRIGLEAGNADDGVWRHPGRTRG